MTPVVRLTKTRAVVGVLLVVSLFVAVADFAGLVYQRRQVIAQARLLSQTKLELVGSIVEAPLLQRKLSAVAAIIEEWSGGNRNLVSFRAVMPNGFDLVTVDRPPHSGITVRARREVRFDGAHLLTLELEERLGEETEKALAGAYKVVIGSIAATLLLVIALWVTFLRAAIVPLEREIARREEVEIGLESAQRELEARVRARTSELSQVLQRLLLHLRNTPLGYIEWNEKLEVTQWNPAAERIFGYAAAEAVTRNVVELIVPPAVKSPVKDDLLSLLRKFEGSRRTYEGVAADGRAVYCELYGAPLRDDDGRFIGGAILVHDVTARRLAEEQQKAGEMQLQHAQKLESMGILAGGIAHDFNNILTAILGNADLVLRGMDQGSPVRKNIEAIEKAARRASALSMQMLAYSGKGKFVIQPVNLSEVVRDLTPLIEASISKKTELRYDLAEGLPSIEGDLTQLRQVVMNLAINASEALGEKGGAVLLKTGTKDCDQACLATRWICEGEKEGAYVYLEVRDDGCGMSEEILEKIFDPFFSTKFAGRGLGLSTVLGITRGHKGAVKVKSEVGRGTIFQALFPRIEQAVPAFREPGKAETPWRASGTVLLVDDEEMVRDIGMQMLEGIGFTVLSARDGIEALEIFRDRAGDVSFVLLDLTMPRMDGEETLGELRRIRPDVKVLLCSGYNATDAVRRFRGKNISGFVQKPFRLNDLAAAIRAVFEPAPGNASRETETIPGPS